MEYIAGMNCIVFIALCVGASVLSVCLLAFAWYYWAVVRPYRLFPSHRLDTTFLLKLVYRRFIYPRNISILKDYLHFEYGGCKNKFDLKAFEDIKEIIKASKRFSKEGCFVLWFFRPFLLIYNEEFNKGDQKRIFSLSVCGWSPKGTTLQNFKGKFESKHVLYLSKELYNNESAVVNKSSIYEFFKTILGNGLLVSDAQTWEIHRKYLDPAFSSDHLNGLMPTFNEKAADLVKRLEKVAGLQTEALEDFIKTCIFNVMAESLLGLNIKDEKCEMTMENFMNLNDNGLKLITKKLTRPWLYFNFISPILSDGRRYLEGLEDVQQFASEAVKEMKKSVHVFCKKGEETFGKILLDEHLLEDHFTAKDVRDHINNIMVGGFNPIFRCLMWCFYALGHNPEIQEKLYREIASGVLEEDVTYKEIGNLKFLDCVIKETLRLYSPVPIYGRKLSKEIKCEKYTLPKGADIFFFPFMLQRNPNLYSDPETFYPERFESNLESQPWIFTPFAEGYRNCIGKVFAQVVIKVLLVHVLRKYKIMSMSRFEEGDLNCIAVLKPTKPFRVLLTFRKSDRQ